MDVEYFPPKEDIILQNETPTDLYILISGAVVLIEHIDGHDQVLRKAVAGEIIGDIGVLCNIPQPYTVRTAQISQVLRLNRATLVKTMRANAENGRNIMNNFYQKLHETQSFGFVDQIRDPYYILHEWRYGEPKGSQLFTEPGSTNFTDSEAIKTQGKNSNIHRYGLDINPTTGTEVISLKKRVTIHMKIQKKNATYEQLGKLIILPDSLEELLRIAGEKFEGCSPTKVLSSENAEIDDFSVIRDGDHLFLLEKECEQREGNPLINEHNNIIHK